jgi:sulfite reductase (NADPH) flavoprotein alpha-component
MSRQQKPAQERHRNKILHKISLVADESVGRTLAFTSALTTNGFAAKQEKQEAVTLPAVVVTDQSNPYVVPNLDLQRACAPVLRSVTAASSTFKTRRRKSSITLDISSEEPSHPDHSTVIQGFQTAGNGHGRNSVLILFGTVTGNAESLARHIARVIALQGFNVCVKNMAHYAADSLCQESCVFIVTSTYGNGEPPDDIIPFWQRVVHGNGLDLRGLKFSVLALGNTTYDRFCQCGRDFDLALERHGATRCYPRVDCDVDYDPSAKRWTEGVFASLQQHLRAGANESGKVATKDTNKQRKGR